MSATQLPCVGFVGLGVMGLPMATNLMRAGYPLVVHNRPTSRTDALVEQGATRADDSSSVAAASDVVITMLPDSPDVVEVGLAADGLLAGARPGLTWIDMSTISPVTARQVATAAAERGVDMLDAPVSGGEKGALEATLSIMVGGPTSVLERCRAILEHLGQTIVHIGEEPGSGQVAKACNQLIVGVTISAVAEA